MKIKMHPSPSPHSNDGKMARFAMRANSSLILMGRGGGGNLFFSIPSKIVAKTRSRVHVM